MRSLPAITALLGLCLALTACVSPPPPKEVFYRFEPLPAAGESGRQKLGKLRIEPLRAQGILSERALLFSHASSPARVEQYRYHHWSKPPAQLLDEDLIQYLQTTGIAKQVLGSDIRAKADWRVDGELLRLERVIDGRKQRVSLEILLRLQRYQSRDLILQQRYAETEPVEGDSMSAAVHAMSRARQRIFERFLTDLKKLPVR